jgi:hypothetical protein
MHITKFLRLLGTALILSGIIRCVFFSQIPNYDFSSPNADVCYSDCEYEYPTSWIGRMPSAYSRGKIYDSPQAETLKTDPEARNFKGGFEKRAAFKTEIGKDSLWVSNARVYWDQWDNYDRNDGTTLMQKEAGWQNWRGCFCKETPKKYVCNNKQDLDCDGILNSVDNCINDYNPDQKNFDLDSLGDACDSDDDNDGIFDDGDSSGTIGDHPCTGGDTSRCDDNCQYASNPKQEDSDGDGKGDICDNIDSDRDGFIDEIDNCPNVHNPDQKDTSDHDGIGNACDDDDDNDGVADAIDNCGMTPNTNQTDTDNDGIGDACDDNTKPVFKGGAIGITWNSESATNSHNANFLSFSTIPATFEENNRRVTFSFATGNTDIDNKVHISWRVETVYGPVPTLTSTSGLNTILVANGASGQILSGPITYNVYARLANPEDFYVNNLTATEWIKQIAQSTADQCVQESIDDNMSGTKSYDECMSPSIVSIQFISDCQDANGINVIKNETATYQNEGSFFPKIEWYPEMNYNSPIVHIRNQKVKILLTISSPLSGILYDIKGESSNPALNFLAQNVRSTGGSQQIQMECSTALPNYPLKIEDEPIGWSIIEKSNGKICSSTESTHLIYVVYGAPIVNKYSQYSQLLNLPTIKRLDLLFQKIENVPSQETAIINVWGFMHDELNIMFKPSNLCSLNIIWKIWDNVYNNQNGEGGQCNEMAYLLECMMGIVGIDASYNQVLPSRTNIRLWNINNPIERFLVDNTKIIPGDEMYLPPGAADSVIVQIERAALMFYFSWGDYVSGWQEGEGTVYYNGKMYTMWASRVIGTGADASNVARSVLNTFQNMNCGNNPIDCYLQKWSIHFLYNGYTRVKRCLSRDVQAIP